MGFTASALRAVASACVVAPHAATAEARVEKRATTAKARVESGESVPFFDERLSCRKDGVWGDYSELVQYARQRIFEPDGEGPLLREALADALSERTQNLSEVLQCNVGVIGGYNLLARSYLALGDDARAHRLLQLALIWVFTLRNALQIPQDAAREWATRTDIIVQDIRLLRRRLGREQDRRVALLPRVSPGLRLPGLRVAIVSICAYPKDHPLLLRTLTPANRRAYAERHGYALHVHMTHPLPGENIHIQHAKLALVAKYLRQGTYDWVAWFDCDSILMNMDKTLDSIIHQHARRSARRPPTKTADAQTPAEQVPLTAMVPEPGAQERLEAFVTHAGSCNSDDGCVASTRLRVNPRVRYTVRVTTALIDMESPSERLASIKVGGEELGPCNPSPESDYDCGFEDCADASVRPESMSDGTLLLEVHSVRTSADCHCSRLHGNCYSAAMAAFEEHTEGVKVTDPRYGLFVKFELLPWETAAWEATFNRSAQEPVGEAEGNSDAEVPSADGCSCRPDQKSVRQQWEPLARKSSEADADPPPSSLIRRRNAECLDGEDLLLAFNASVTHCLNLCRMIEGCRFVSHGRGLKRGRCYWELSPCLQFEEDAYHVYDIGDFTQEGGALNVTRDCSAACRALAALPSRDSVHAHAPSNDDEPAAQKDEDEDELRLPVLPLELDAVDDSVDLLITDEGWGLSSANWLIRRSNWSIDFLDKAFHLCQDEMPLFGDQDAMIHLLFNSGALGKDDWGRGAAADGGDPLDSHAVIVPQREFNSYDSLNAHYMGCDGYKHGDLLVTFPGCKDPQGCNDLFQLAANYARRSAEAPPAPPPSIAQLRLFGPPEVAAEVFEAARERQRQLKAQR